MTISRIRSSKIIWIVSAILIALLATFATNKFLQSRREAKCVADAEKTVATYLQSNPFLSLGDFQQLTGEGYGGPTFGSPAGFYLQAKRVAHFTKGSEEITIYVHPRHPTQANEISVYLVQETMFHVSHPALVEH